MSTLDDLPDAAQAGAEAAQRLEQARGQRTYGRPERQVPAKRLGLYLARHKRDADALKVRARTLTKAMVDAGYVRPRPPACERCGVKGAVHCHHLDYTRPELVLYLCPDCHRAQHRALAWQRLWDSADHAA